MFLARHVYLQQSPSIFICPKKSTSTSLLKDNLTAFQACGFFSLNTLNISSSSSLLGRLLRGQNHTSTGMVFSLWLLSGFFKVFIVWKWYAKVQVFVIHSASCSLCFPDLCGLVSDINFGKFSVVVSSISSVPSSLLLLVFLSHVCYTFCSCLPILGYSVLFYFPVLFSLLFSFRVFYWDILQLRFPRPCLVYLLISASKVFFLSVPVFYLWCLFILS